MVLVSPAGGLTLKRWYADATIPWDQLASYKLDAGAFYVWRVGQKHTKGLPAESVPNAWVLLGLLNAAAKAASTTKS